MQLQTTSVLQRSYRPSVPFRLHSRRSIKQHVCGYLSMERLTLGAYPKHGTRLDYDRTVAGFNTTVLDSKGRRLKGPDISF
jgi:hypothetical protein